MQASHETYKFNEEKIREKRQLWHSDIRNINYNRILWEGCIPLGCIQFGSEKERGEEASTRP